MLVYWARNGDSSEAGAEALGVGLGVDLDFNKSAADLAFGEAEGEEVFGAADADAAGVADGVATTAA